MASTTASSSASQVGGLPRIDCPKCKIQNDDTCVNYWFEDQYLAYLRANHPDKLRDVEVEGVQGPFVAPAVQGIEQKCDINIGMMDLKV
ncbi:unnamed protein product [Miscanthus lutarioriparius]|uniref:Uncharacterized protein n=1 Tax=Miscanthus lutarioriparius TaxID=422564 RepID=A0A811Q7S8_9POAL|nr:unnamed protein product [Miscanthus lutarioriparius]